ncbi:MAG: hypothetical protein R2828_08945 [Saprospiraceae bacterium]
MKSKQEFDRFIRERMEDFEAEGQPKGWSRLAQGLEKEEEVAGTAKADEKVLEAVIFDKMTQLEVAYQPVSWTKLESLLNEEYRFVNKIIRYKSLELSIFLLLIALFVNYYPQTPNAKAVPLKTQAIAAETKEKTQSSTENIATHATTGNEATATKESQLNTDHANVALGYVVGEAQPIAAKEEKALAKSISAVPQAPVLPTTNKLAVSSIASENNSSANKLSKQPPLVISTPQTTILDQILWASIDPIPDLAISPSSYEEVAIAEVKPSPKERFFRFGMLGASDYNHVITPPTLIDGKSYSANRYALGYSGGLTFSWGTNRWEIETGLVYAAKKYLPLPLSEVEYSLEEGLSGEQLKTFEYEMIAIPLNVRYHFIPNGKWRFYAIGGVGLNTVLQADYFITDPVLPEPGPPPSFAPSVPRNDNNTKAGIDKKAFTKGFFQGGSFSENTYFTANFGMGLERFISHRTSLYAQPHYQRSLFYLKNGGLGPFNDQVHTMSLILGMRVKL